MLSGQMLEKKKSVHLKFTILHEMKVTGDAELFVKSGRMWGLGLWVSWERVLDTLTHTNDVIDDICCCILSRKY